MLRRLLIASVAPFLLCSGAQAHKLAKAHVDVAIAKSSMVVSPSRDWNGIGGRQGKSSEVWTIDGERLNELIFYVGLPAGSALAPKMKKTIVPTWQEKTLLVELPELVESTWRVTRGITDFTQMGSRPCTFLGHNGVAFDYEYVNGDQLHVRGSAVATTVNGQLYMVALNAPRLYYFDRAKPAFDAIVASAKLN